MELPAPADPLPPGPTSVGLVALLLVFAALLISTDSKKYIGVDFYQFWVVGQAAGRPGTGDVYSDGVRLRLGQEFYDRAMTQPSDRLREAATFRKVLETFSTPLLYTGFGLLATGDFDRDRAAWQLISFASMALAVVLLCRMLRFSALGTGLWLVLVIEWFSPFHADLLTGNVNSVQLLALTLFLWVQTRRTWRHRDLISGAILALAVLFKPNLALAAVVLSGTWLLQRQYRKVLWRGAGAAAGALVGVTASTLYFGSMRCWLDWLRAISTLGHHPVRFANYAPAELIYEATGHELSVTITSALLVLTGGVLLLSRRRAAATTQQDSTPTPEWIPDLLALALAALITLLGSPLAWSHYFLVNLVILLYLLRPRPPGSLSAKVWVQQGLVLAVVVAHAWSALRGYFWLTGIRNEAIQVIVACVLLFGLTLGELSARLPRAEQ